MQVATTASSVSSPAASRLAQSPQGVLCGLRMCACCCCEYMIKMTCAVNWIIVRERRAESTSLSGPDLAGSRGKTVSRHLELSPDAVDDKVGKKPVNMYWPCRWLEPVFTGHYWSTGGRLGRLNHCCTCLCPVAKLALKAFPQHHVHEIRLYFHQWTRQNSFYQYM